MLKVPEYLLSRLRVLGLYGTSTGSQDSGLSTSAGPTIGVNGIIKPALLRLKHRLP